MANHVATLQGGGRGWTLASVAVGWLLILGMRFAVPTLLPQVKASFGLDNAGAGLAVTVIWLTYGIAQFPAGLLVDVLGGRRLLAGSLALAAAAIVGLGLSPVFGVFLAACAGFGLGTGLFGPARGLVLSKVFSDAEGAAFGATLAAGSLGAAALPFAAGMAVEWVGWRLTLAATGPLFLASAVALWRTVPVAATDGGRPATPDSRTVLSALSTRRVVVASLAVTGMLFAFQGLTAFLPTYLVEVKGLAGGPAAGLFATLFVVGAVAQLGAGSAADRYGDRRVLVTLALLSVLPLAAIPFAGSTVALAAVVALVGGRLGVIPITNAYLIRSLPPGVQGTAWGLLRTLLFLVGSTASTVVGWLADLGYFDEAFLGLAAVTLVGGLLYALLPPDDGD